MTSAPLGWRNSSPQAALAFLPPEPLSATEAAGLAPGWAPNGALAHRIFVIRAAFNLRIKMVRQGGRIAGYRQVREPGALSETGFRGLVSPIQPTAQRDPKVPACQISLNLIFISDVPCSIQLMPPIFAPSFRKWPGTLVCGRYPVTSWPRALNAVLEWQELDKDWVLRRGDPIACVMPVYQDPDLVPDLFEARMTPALKRHLARLDGVGEVGRNVGPMFAAAEAARPKRLLERKIAE